MTCDQFDVPIGRATADPRPPGGIVYIYGGPDPRRLASNRRSYIGLIAFISFMLGVAISLFTVNSIIAVAVTAAAASQEAEAAPGIHHEITGCRT